MGIEYSLINHSNATYYELGKGDWYLINDNKWILYEPEFFVEFFNDNHKRIQKEEFKEEILQYYKLIGEELKEFVKGIDEKSLIVIGDCMDSHIYLLSLKYKCLGTRYYLGDPVENKESVDYENKRVQNWHYPIEDDEFEQMKMEGWNFKNIRKKFDAIIIPMDLA